MPDALPSVNQSTEGKHSTLSLLLNATDLECRTVVAVDDDEERLTSKRIQITGMKTKHTNYTHWHQHNYNRYDGLFSLHHFHHHFYVPLTEAQ